MTIRDSLIIEVGKPEFQNNPGYGFPKKFRLAGLR